MTKKASMTPATGVTTKDGKGKTTQFANGSIFAMNCTGEVTVTVAAGTSLSITTASCSMEDKETAALRYRPTTKFGGKSQSVVLCLFEEQHCTVSGLNLTCEGPKTFELSTTAACAVSVCGSVSRIGSTNVVQETDDMVTGEKSPPVIVLQRDEPPLSSKKRKITKDEKAKALLDELQDMQQDERAAKSKKAKKDTPTKKTDEKEVDKEETAKEETDGDAAVLPPQKLSKKQRRKLAKKKAKELEEAVALLNHHASKDTTSSTGKDKKTFLPNHRARRVRGGVLVKDIIIGQGNTVQNGRKVGICYEGRLADTDKVFDRNRSKKEPLTFRPGTGQVISGLERGVAGMKVGGEREITIPPEMGYGEKGSGAVVPAGATLVFTVQLISAGNG